jgi:hypothetical protein
MSDPANIPPKPPSAGTPRALQQRPSDDDGLQRRRLAKPAPVVA